MLLFLSTFASVSKITAVAVVGVQQSQFTELSKRVGLEVDLKVGHDAEVSIEVGPGPVTSR